MSAASPITPTPPAMHKVCKGLNLKAEMISEDSDAFWRPRLSEETRARCTEALHYVKRKLADPEALEAEFVALRTTMPDAFKRLQAARANSCRNRYLDVVPFDDTRVVLRGQPDYINASFIEGPPSQTKLPTFIATQGPLRSTMADFWEMVMQQRSPVIVMLTRVLDGREEKCAPYFPCDVGEAQVFGRLQVTNKSFVSSRYSLAKRIFEVQRLESEEAPLSVLHLEYLDWPDHGVPVSTQPIRELFRCVSCVQADAGPVVVHCSAGIGRTGTYITVDFALRRLLKGDMSAVKLDDTVRHLRLQRLGMVQMKSQYQFCFAAIADELGAWVSA